MLWHPECDSDRCAWCPAPLVYRKRSQSGNELCRGSQHVMPSDVAILAVTFRQKRPANVISPSSWRSNSRWLVNSRWYPQILSHWRATHGRQLQYPPPPLGHYQDRGGLWRNATVTLSGRNRGTGNDDAVRTPVGDALQAPCYRCRWLGKERTPSHISQ